MKKLYKLVTKSMLFSGLTLGISASILSGDVFAQCNNTYPYGSATAPTAFNSAVTISTCSYQEEYSTLNSVVASSFYECAITTGGYVTIRQGSSSGTVVAFGNSPLLWQAPTSGTYYAHWNVNASCATASSCVTTTITRKGCINTTAYGSITAPTAFNTSSTISTCSYYGEYSTISSVVAGSDYQCGINAGGYVTITQGTSNGTIVAYGPSPLVWQAPSSGTYYAHWNSTSSCGSSTSCQTTTIMRLGCTNTSSYGSATAPTSFCTATTISTCSYQTEYSTINSIVAGSNYQCAISSGGYITMHKDAYNGPIVANGSSPLTWSAPTSGTYYAHWNTNSSCGTATGCLTTTITRVGTVPADPTSITASASAICEGDSVTLTANGGVGVVYWYTGACGTTGQIDTGASITISPGAATTYYIRNYSGCFFSANCVNTAITVNPLPDVAMSSNDVNCNGGSDGDATATGSGGTTPYAYAWSNSTSSATAGSLAAGSYTVTLTDNNGCMDIDSVTVEEPTLLVASFVSSMEPLCNGDTNGMMSISASGGVTPYSFNWSSGSTGATNSGIGAGTYTATVTDDNNCTQTIEVVLSEPTALAVASFSVDALCKGGNDGAAVASATGGTAPYTYLWSDSNSTSSDSISELGEGSYGVIITDSNGCQIIDSVTISYEFENPTIALEDTMLLCQGFEITLDAGADSTAMFMWSSDTNATSNSIIVGAGGDYTVTVYSAAGCMSVKTVTVVEDECLSIEEFDNLSVEIYPNPTLGVLNLMVDGLVSDNAFVEIMNLNGQRVALQSLNQSNNLQAVQIDLSDVAKGMYMLNFEHQGMVRTYRVVVQ